uniref:Uncharacterized protein n=1 Tax=Rhizophora mucronata TaxID=61149 RepID=A0A2P2NC25_RHIMU
MQVNQTTNRAAISMPSKYQWMVILTLQSSPHYISRDEQQTQK